MVTSCWNLPVLALAFYDKALSKHLHQQELSLGQPTAVEIIKNFQYYIMLIITMSNDDKDGHDNENYDDIHDDNADHDVDNDYYGND